MWAALGKVATGAVQGGAKKIATDKLLNRKKKPAVKKPTLDELIADVRGSGEPAKGGALAVRPSTSLVPSFGGDVQKFTGREGEYGSIEDNVIRIKSKVIAVDGILKGTLAAEKARKEKQLRAQEQADAAAAEADLEGKKKKKKGPNLKKFVPKVAMNAFQKLVNFFQSMVLGYVTIQLLPLLPQLLKFVKGLSGVVDWFLDIGLGLLDGLMTLVDWGYKLYDMAMGFVKNLVGEEGAKKLESFMGVLKDLFSGFLVFKIIGQKILTSIVKSITRAFSIAKAIVKRALKFAKNFVKNAAQRLLKIPGAKKVVQSIANVGGKVLNVGKNVLGKTANIAKNIGGKVLNVGKNILGLGKNVAAKGAGKVGGWAAKIFGKAAKVVAPAMKAAMPAVKGFARRIPIMGPLIVALVSMLTGDPVSKALFKGVGAALGGTLGTFIPIPFLGTLIGETIGVYVGDLMHTLLMGGGMEAAGQRLKQDFGKVLKAGGKVFDWVKGGFSRFITTFKAENKTRFGITNWLALLNLGKTIPLLAKSFFSGDSDAPPLEDEKAAKKKEKEARKKKRKEERETKKKEAKEKRDKFVGDVKDKAGKILEKANPLNWFKSDKGDEKGTKVVTKTDLTGKMGLGGPVGETFGGKGGSTYPIDSISEYASYEDGSEEVVLLQDQDSGDKESESVESKKILLVPVGTSEDAAFDSLYVR